MNKDFLDFLKQSNQEIFIEAEATKDKMYNFIQNYNSNWNPPITQDQEGICILGNVDKWGVELRVYFNDISGLSQYWLNKKYKNRKYRADKFSYRLDDSDLVNYLFNNGYHLGYN